MFALKRIPYNLTISHSAEITKRENRELYSY